MDINRKTGKKNTAFDHKLYRKIMGIPICMYTEKEKQMIMYTKELLSA